MLMAVYGSNHPGQDQRCERQEDWSVGRKRLARRSQTPNEM